MRYAPGLAKQLRTQLGHRLEAVLLRRRRRFDGGTKTARNPKCDLFGLPRMPSGRSDASTNLGGKDFANGALQA